MIFPLTQIRLIPCPGATAPGGKGGGANKV